MNLGEHLGAIAAALAALAFAPIPASAQTTGEIPYVDAVDAWADGQSLRRTLPGSGAGAFKKPARPRHGKRPRTPTARQLAALRFKRTKTVTQQNHQAVMQRLLNGYGAFHARTSAPDTPILAVQSAARRSMALSRQIRGLSAARKQTAAEMLELRTILRISDLNVARQTGDAPREQAARAALRTWIRDVFGVDLERVRLTRAGLVRR